MVSSTEFAELEQQQIYNYPNPVIGSTRFHANLGSNYSQTESIQINILDIRGQVVKSIISSDNNGQGKFNTEIWNAADESGNQLAAGVYFCSIIAQDKDGKINTIAAKSNIQIR
jgi:flagellar hook assembly protein FlgD